MFNEAILSGNGGGGSKQLEYEIYSQTTSSRTTFNLNCEKRPKYILRSIYFGASPNNTWLNIYDVDNDECVMISNTNPTPSPNNYITKISDTSWNFDTGSTGTTTHLITFVYEKES